MDPGDANPGGAGDLFRPTNCEQMSAECSLVLHDEPYRRHHHIEEEEDRDWAEGSEPDVVHHVGRLAEVALVRVEKGDAGDDAGRPQGDDQGGDPSGHDDEAVHQAR